MSNRPLPDVELVLKENYATELPRLRIRLRENRQIVEISQCDASQREAKQRGWNTKRLPASLDGTCLVAKPLENTLTESERDGLLRLAGSLITCDNFDNFLKPVDLGGAAHTPPKSEPKIRHATGTPENTPFTRIKSRPGNSIKSILHSSRSNAKAPVTRTRQALKESPPSCSMIKIKQDFTPMCNAETTRSLQRGSYGSLSTRTSRTAGADPLIRFIESIGWCMHLTSAKYKIMFLDGVCLTVDVDEEMVEYVDKEGASSR